MGLFKSLRSRLFRLATPEPKPDETSQSSPDPNAQSTIDQTAVSTTDSTVAGTEAETDEAVPARSSDASPTTDPDLSARQERAANRLLDDERLRGDLTDDEFQPLLDWAMAAAERIVDSTAGDSDERAERRIDAGLSIVRERVAAAAGAVTAYAEGDHDRLTASLRAAGLLPNDAKSDGAISRLFVQRDLAGPDVAAQIVGQLSTGAGEPSDRATGGTT